MKQLIVNADDFGLTAGVSRGILDAYREGIVTSTTLMANGASFADAAYLSRRVPELGVGVHLNLTEGAPVSPAWKIPTLTNREGRLHLTPRRLLLGIMTRQVSLAEVERELEAQVEAVCGAGISPTHFDGHKHVHVLPGVAQVVIRLAHRFSVSCVRCPSEAGPELPAFLRTAKSRTAAAKQYLVGRAVASFASRFKAELEKAGLFSPEHFYGLSQTGFLNSRCLQQILSNLPEGISELMCHPGRLDLELAMTGTRLLNQREVELLALTAPEVRNLVSERGINLVHFGKVSAPVKTIESRGRRPLVKVEVQGNSVEIAR